MSEELEREARRALRQHGESEPDVAFSDEDDLLTDEDLAPPKH